MLLNGSPKTPRCHAVIYVSAFHVNILICQTATEKRHSSSQQTKERFIFIKAHPQSGD